MSVSGNPGNYTRLRRKNPKIVTVSARKERNLSIKKVSVILQKDESKRTKEEKELLFTYSEIVKEASLRIEKRKKIKERLKEVEDSEAILDDKCKRLADAIHKSEYLVVYTGAGISTAARIPDYRGASGIWTLLQQGKDIGTHDLTQADPTYTHMALFQLYSLGKLKHVVSQNCDGLHLRSGLPRKALSEVHGNMYIEVCRSCRPIIEYLRLFDVTENTGRYSHRTMRKCYKCNSSLVDCVVHFGERGNLPWPLNWKGACRAAEKADMILCIGSSLKVLKRYPWLWCMDKPARRRPSLYIVNLQWTPKDCHAIIKINGKCDIVMEKLMKYLSITVPKYSRYSDPIFEHSTDLCKEELHTLNRPLLAYIKSEPEPENEKGAKPEKSIPVDSAIIKESSVTSCKKEIIIDTGQGEDLKFIKKELIVITIRTGDDFKDCCSLFKSNQGHELNCPNFIDEGNDIPVIIQDDLVVVKKEKSETSEVTAVKLKTSAQNESNSTDSYDSIDEIGGLAENNSKFAQNYFSGDDLIPISQLIWGWKKAEEDSKRRNLKGEVKKEFKEENGNGERTEGEKRFPSMEEHGKNSFKRRKLETSTDPFFDCNFCRDRYASNCCLFYPKRKPFFNGNVSTCDCCSSVEEEEDTESEIPAAEDKGNESQKSTVNPGWYGKGLRKNNRKRR